MIETSPVAWDPAGDASAWLEETGRRCLRFSGGATGVVLLMTVTVLPLAVAVPYGILTYLTYVGVVAATTAGLFFYNEVDVDLPERSKRVELEAGGPDQPSVSFGVMIAGGFTILAVPSVLLGGGIGLFVHPALAPVAPPVVLRVDRYARRRYNQSLVVYGVGAARWLYIHVATPLAPDVEVITETEPDALEMTLTCLAGRAIAE